jgi:UPF0176 protein
MITVCALYQFIRLHDIEELRLSLHNLMENLEIKGTILLASEGLNGTISGDKKSIDKVVDFLINKLGCDNLEIKFSQSKNRPFKRLKVKIKPEIVTLGIANIDPLSDVGTYVSPQDWNALISDPDVVVIDTRNNYEYEIGSFKGAINPNTEAFREFPDYTKNNLEAYRGKKVAMFCTGGIRCEKSTAYLKSQGFEAVYHLRGGILKYLEEIEETQSLWQGECFVFDERVALKHNLAQGQYDQCHACRYPITAADKAHQQYEKGVSCPRCFGKRSPTQTARYRERQKQVVLASERGEVHIGDGAAVKIKQKIAGKS